MVHCAVPTFLPYFLFYFCHSIFLLSSVAKSSTIHALAQVGVAVQKRLQLEGGPGKLSKLKFYNFIKLGKFRRKTIDIVGGLWHNTDVADTDG